MHSGGQTAPPAASGLPGPGPGPGTSTGPPQQSQQSQQSSNTFDSARRAPALGRNPEELHISTSGAAMSQPGSSQYNSPDPYSAGGPNINLHQATPQGGAQYANAPAPASLQPGPSSQQPQQQQQQQQQQRPNPTTAYTAPSTVPTMPQINTNAQQYTLPTRSNTMNQTQHSSSHNYSRSSPAGLGPEQKYIPFSHTPENLKYAGSPAQKYYPSTPSGGASNSPLGLADIRPRANSSMNDEALGGGSYLNDGDRMPSNSNYLAPWGVYAFDWCKWNVQGGNSAGKMAIGSYLEDTHNFVCLL
jgi:WD repeat-containing protein 68